MSGWPYFVDVEKSDLLIKPDLNSFRILLWSRERRGYAGVMCDIYHPDTLEQVEKHFTEYGEFRETGGRVM